MMNALIIEAEDEILNIVADAQVRGKDPTDEFMLAKQINGDIATAALIRRGIRSILREQRSELRLEMKVLKLDPGFYDKIRARAREGNLPEDGISQLQPASEKLVLKREKSNTRARQIAERSEKLNKAMALYDIWALPDGSALGDATREKLISEASKERATADGHIKNADFYETLAGEMSPGSTVREAVPLDKAHKIREGVYTPSQRLAA